MDHHYVPDWYQRRFLNSGQAKYFLLDLQKRKREYANPRSDYLKYRPTKWCFFESDLYSKYFHTYKSDVIEERFFGKIDAQGKFSFDVVTQKKVLEFDPKKYFYAFIDYLCAQFWRTPRGLRFLTSTLGDQVFRLESKAIRNLTLDHLQMQYQIFASAWIEGYWEIVETANETDSFLVSDNPVCLYNSKVHPRKNGVFSNVPLGLAGTQTVIALSRNKCLIISHPDYVESVNFSRPFSFTAQRKNFGVFRDAIFNVDDIVYGRKLSSSEVDGLNNMFLETSDQYVAFSNKDKLLKLSHHGDWGKYSAILKPREGAFKFHTETFLSYTDGSVEGFGGYGGRLPDSESRTKAEQMQQSFERALKKHNAEKSRGKF